MLFGKSGVAAVVTVAGLASTMVVAFSSMTSTEETAGCTVTAAEDLVVHSGTTTTVELEVVCTGNASATGFRCSAPSFRAEVKRLRTNAGLETKATRQVLANVRPGK